MRVQYDDALIDLQEGASGVDLARHLKKVEANEALVMERNGLFVDLSTPLAEGDRVRLFDFVDEKGREVFWHTSAHVLAQAVCRLYPQAKPTIGPPIREGFYYDFADLPLKEEELPLIEAEVEKILKERYLTERTLFATKEEALSCFGDNPYKRELIEGMDEGETITAYRQGEFFDLCRGPHLPSLAKIKAFKLLKTAGAYWRGDSKNVMLTRLYAISFPDRLQLKEFLQRQEEAKKRDHKLLGPKLDLFSLHEEAPGIPFIHPHGLRIWNVLVDDLRDLLKRRGYQEIKTPQLLQRELWERSGHWDNYRDHMFVSEVEERQFAIKPMSCPGCMLYYKTHVHSYRELPLRVAELGHVHRFEPSGSLSGLLRVRGFHQDDAHLFMEREQIEGEILAILSFARELYSRFGLNYHLELSTRPKEKTIGSDEEWEFATEGLRRGLELFGAVYKVNEGDGAFYGPKIDFHVTDALGRSWQLGTVQLDMALPLRFDLEYVASDGSRKRPVMLHRAIYGSIERFFAILIEHFSGKFPLFLSPRQVRIITVADRHATFGKKVEALFCDEGFYVDLDSSSQSVSKKVREAQLLQYNYILTVGDEEEATSMVDVRTRDNRRHGSMAIDRLLSVLKQEKSSRSLEAGL